MMKAPIAELDARLRTTVFIVDFRRFSLDGESKDRKGNKAL